MKTLAQVVRRYILLAVGVVVLIVVVNLVLFLGIVIYFGAVQKEGFTQYAGSQIAAAVTLQNGQPVLSEEVLQNWDDGWEWAMLLDDSGAVTWRHNLPAYLDHPYTVPEVVSFSRWFLDDYPVMSYITDYGVLVLAKPQGSMNRWNLYMASNQSSFLAGSIAPILVLDFVLVLALALLLGWRSGQSLRKVSAGIDILAAGGCVALPETGMAGELAAKLNRTSARLQRQNEIIARRDTARTNWIAGVSHDIRTPLSLILGYAEQLGAETALPDTARQKAGKISDQAARIKSLVEDLNLTSKLQYDAQPLRRSRCSAGALLRGAITAFCNSGTADACTVDFDITPAAQGSVLFADQALLTRALENVLGNSARHNPGGCAIQIRADARDGQLILHISDDGAGYPAAVLASLGENPPEADAPAPHVLGLHLVARIVAAHGGSAAFTQARPHGACVTLRLPLAG